HHPLADVAAGGQLDAADLDAAVGRVQAVFDFQLEVLRLAAAPDDEGVLLDRVLRRALADQRAALDVPESRVAIPAVHRLAVEDRLEPGVVRRRQRLGPRGPVAAASLAGRATTLTGERNDCEGDGNGERISHDTASCFYATFTWAAGIDCHWRVRADFNTASVTRSVASPSRKVGDAGVPFWSPSTKSAN